MIKTVYHKMDAGGGLGDSENFDDEVNELLEEDWKVMSIHVTNPSPSMAPRLIAFLTKDDNDE